MKGTGCEVCDELIAGRDQALQERDSFRMTFLESLFERHYHEIHQVGEQRETYAIMGFVEQSHTEIVGGKN